jgi:hypothetical protein
VIAACAAGGTRKAASPETAPASSGAPSVLGTDRHAEIEQLDQAIDADRMSMQLVEPALGEIGQAPTHPLGAMPHTQDPKCRPAQSDTCKTSCTLSDSICSNANKICDLASSMPGDNWAMNKCAKANKTCESSRTKCCGCQ